MLPASSGSSFLRHNYVCPIIEITQVGEARRFATNLSTELDFGEVSQGRVAILINELGNNLLKYAKNGRLLIRQIDQGVHKGIEILSVDQGNGFDVGTAMQDGFTTGDTPGTGLGAISRQADEFDIYSDKNGTVIMARVYKSANVPLEGFAFSAISVPYKEESTCGDAWQVRQNSDSLEIFVIDGLGHGVLANKAALEAVDVFEQSPHLSLEMLIQSVHGRLKATRGGAVFALKVLGQMVEYSGVGNIRALIDNRGNHKALISQNGTAGLQIRAAKALNQNWDGQGYIIVHSDGLGSRWSIFDYPGLFSKHPAIVAGVLYRDHDRRTDDVTVVVARKNIK